MLKTKFAPRSIKRIAAVAIGLVTCLAPTMAMATLTNFAGVASWVRAQKTELRVISVGPSGTMLLYAYPDTYGSCPGVGQETLKLYTSLAQASLLSGKKIGVNYFDCTNNDNVTVHYISDMELRSEEHTS